MYAKVKSYRVWGKSERCWRNSPSRPAVHALQSNEQEPQDLPYVNWPSHFTSEKWSEPNCMAICRAAASPTAGQLNGFLASFVWPCSSFHIPICFAFEATKSAADAVSVCTEQHLFLTLLPSPGSQTEQSCRI